MCINDFSEKHDPLGVADSMLSLEGKIGYGTNVGTKSFVRGAGDALTYT